MDVFMIDLLIGICMAALLLSAFANAWEKSEERRHRDS
jgi:hypothetical protein